MSHQPKAIIEHPVVNASVSIIKSGERVTLAIQSGETLEVLQYTNSNWYERRLVAYQSGCDLLLYVGPALPGRDETQHFIWINDGSVKVESGNEGWVSYGMCEHILTPVWETVS